MPKWKNNFEHPGFDSGIKLKNGITKQEFIYFRQIQINEIDDSKVIRKLSDIIFKKFSGIKKA